MLHFGYITQPCLQFLPCGVGRIEYIRYINTLVLLAKCALAYKEFVAGFEPSSSELLYALVWYQLRLTYKHD